MSIAVTNVSKRFGDFLAVNDVSLQVANGSLLALLGPSGCGKTTLLRIVAGLEVADSGTVIHHDEDVTHRSARDRRVGFVFQHYALFRHMTIEDNIGYGLRVRDVPKEERRGRVDELLKLVRLDGFGKRYPGQLSGGQRQRVALARALAARPKVLLLDEPFGALDAKVRQELRQWIRRLHEEIHVTSVFVTHDQEEAFEVADDVVIMNQGRIEQVGSPAEVFEQPANAFVLDFLGDVNVFNGSIRKGKAVVAGVEVPLPQHRNGDAADATLYVRPHEFTVERTRTVDGIEATVAHVNITGSRVRVELRLAGSNQLVSADVPGERFSELALTAGDVVYVVPRRVHVFVV